MERIWAIPVIVSILFLGGFGFSQDANAIPVFSFEFGSGGSDPGQFTNPQSATTDSNDRIIVADTNNHRIQVFDSTGVFQQSITDADGAGGTFSFPHGVTTDSNDRIIVADTNNNRIHIFDFTGLRKIELISGGEAKWILRQMKERNDFYHENYLVLIREFYQQIAQNSFNDLKEILNQPKRYRNSAERSKLYNQSA